MRSWSACASVSCSKISSKACTQVLPPSLPTFLSAPLLQTLPDAEAGESLGQLIGFRRVMTMGLNQGGDRELRGRIHMLRWSQAFYRESFIYIKYCLHTRVWHYSSFSRCCTMGQHILLWFLWLLFDLEICLQSRRSHDSWCWHERPPLRDLADHLYCTVLFLSDSDPINQCHLLASKIITYTQWSQISSVSKTTKSSGKQKVWLFHKRSKV